MHTDNGDIRWKEEGKVRIVMLVNLRGEGVRERTGRGAHALCGCLHVSLSLSSPGENSDARLVTMW